MPRLRVFLDQFAKYDPEEQRENLSREGYELHWIGGTAYKVFDDEMMVAIIDWTRHGTQIFKFDGAIGQG